MLTQRKYIELASAMAADPFWSLEAGMVLTNDPYLKGILWC